MGIRYFAISIDQEDYERISAGPCPTCGTRPHRRDPEDDWNGDWNAIPVEPDTLDLDKAWHYLQRMLGSRPAQALVQGNATNTSRGWISHQGVVAPSEVPVIAADLASVAPHEVIHTFQEDGHWRSDRAEEDYSYAMEYLARAVTFTRKVASDGRGIVYYIG